MTVLIPKPFSNSTTFRTTLGCFPTGVAIVTTLNASEAPVGLTISSFNSVSLSPPLVLWSLSRLSECVEDFQARGSFAINILSADQTDLCNRFAQPNINRFEGVDWHPSCEGLPILTGVSAVMMCKTHAVHDGGDHEIYIGKVISHAHGENAPMVYAKGKISQLT